MPWSEASGLAAGDAGDGPGPEASARLRADGVALLQLTFRAGQTLADHSAPKPILLLGQRGRIAVHIGGGTVTLQPGSALHITAREPHALTAETDAVATLLLLG
ncbi:cupin domain-containing protein [Tsukamurella sp. 8F]|uniref:cupin domain-containing protein n=1 Tax=unclassified Tsukamurella TaxID=2633480 RepID=UPI0023B8CA50|nr:MULTISPECIES: cupin domain-containing protein [unclassified Tsukamurella]MDF0532193.1 cupin domain-containing protein [Tsukamurella sp. 8J]MDF0589244.1 cupin domain-containing protein [Tsukamurella sp. 8F]